MGTVTRYVRSPVDATMVAKPSQSEDVPDFASMPECSSMLQRAAFGRERDGRAFLGDRSARRSSAGRSRRRAAAVGPRHFDGARDRRSVGAVLSLSPAAGRGRCKQARGGKRCRRCGGGRRCRGHIADGGRERAICAAARPARDAQLRCGRRRHVAHRLLPAWRRRWHRRRPAPRRAAARNGARCSRIAFLTGGAGHRARDQFGAALQDSDRVACSAGVCSFRRQARGRRMHPPAAMRAAIAAADNAELLVHIASP